MPDAVSLDTGLLQMQYWMQIIRYRVTSEMLISAADLIDIVVILLMFLCRWGGDLKPWMASYKILSIESIVMLLNAYQPLLPLHANETFQ